jgi:D-hydroxyproline dehydrogenase subunit alpha
MDEASFKFEIVVVGAGPAGLAAASVAAENGRRVALVDDTPWLGGQIWRGQQARPSIPRALRWMDRFGKSGAALFDSTSVIGAAGERVLLAEHPRGPRQVQWERLILATGARELFLPFPGWTLPGVFGPGGLQSLVKHGWPIERKRVVVAGSGPLLLAVAAGLRKHGAAVISINEQAPWSRVMSFGLGLVSMPGKLFEAAQLRLRLGGAPYRCGVWPVGAGGDEQVRAVTLTDGRRSWSEDCDLLACGFGLVPNVELPLALGCQLNDGFVRVDESQATTVAGVYCAGEPAGIGGADSALVEGQIAGHAASGKPEKATPLVRSRARWRGFAAALAGTFALRPELKQMAAPETLVCRCEDVTCEKMKAFDSWRDAKLQTRCGMGACQGRVCGAASKVIFGWGMESVRPPILPARVESLIRDWSSMAPMDPRQTAQVNKDAGS